ncbi:MAG: heavy metal translocating P-type ATPase [Bacillota bacterium]
MGNGQQLKRITLKIADMTCASCAQKVEEALNNTSGVKEATVNFAAEKATIDYNPNRVNVDDLVKKVRDTGYDVNFNKKNIKVGGMTCASCAQSIENALNDIEGVIDATVNFAAEKANVEFNPDQVSEYDLEKTIENTGYEVIKEDETEIKDQNEDEEKIAEARNKMLWSWGLTIPIILWMIPEMFLGIAWPNEIIYHLGMIALALPILLWVGRKTYYTAYKAISHGSANMDVLIAMGTGAAFVTGPASFFTPLANYAGVAGMIMTFHLTGRYIEAKAKGRASQAIKKLLELGANTATVIREGEEVEVSVEEVQVGDIMIIKPGEKVPTDGEIIEGESALDESMATGESMPVKKSVGDEVIGATINQRGLIKVKATKVGKDTFLSQVIKMVEEAQGTKVPIQEFADRVTSIFVPTVLAIAALTFGLWLLFPGALREVTTWAATFLPWVNPNLGLITGAIFATIAVLVIACPCALGLATPTALMVGTGMGAENGVLIRKGEAIQTLKEVHTIVFDKTGTITEGHPAVTDLEPNDGFNEEELLQLAASVEAGSEHPLGEAIVRRAKEDDLEIEDISDFEAITGKGVQAKVDDKQVLVGSRRLMNEEGIDTSQVEEKMKELEEEAKTAMLIGVENQLAGIIAVADPLKEDSKEAIAELRDLGLETAMITGDNERTAQAIADKVGIDHVVAEVLPDGKVDEIMNLQDKFGIIAMVGDGINDAPALTQANVGIAIGTGTDIAIESSDVTLVRGNLSSVITAIKLSRATFRKIKQNLFWAFIYNTIAIPVAILGLLHPIIAEAAMATSSISVVTNANLLRRVNIQPRYKEE